MQQYIFVGIDYYSVVVAFRFWVTNVAKITHSGVAHSQ